MIVKVKKKDVHQIYKCPRILVGRIIIISDYRIKI